MAWRYVCDWSCVRPDSLVVVQMENFRKPNFELVADILFWMVKLYDQDCNISDRVEFEDERVEFLTGIASLMATKARLKLNTKKLYASDGRAVQEMLKFASLLYTANKYSKGPINEDTTPPPIKIQEVKQARTLASDITQSGAKLSDFLAHEVNDKVDRAKALRFLDSAGSSSEGSREHMFIERSVKELIDRTRTMVEDMKKESDELAADERNIESKIRKKQEELERTEKRMKSLESVRPQFMDEVEKLEKELTRHYDVYIEKVRNLDYLEHELEKYHKAEEERKEEHDRKLRKMRERLRKEEVDLLRGEIAESGGFGKSRSPGGAESKFGGDGTFSRKPQAKYEEEESDDDEEFPDDDDISDDDSDLDTESGSDEHF